MPREYLFANYDLSSALKQKQNEIKEQVDKISRDQFLATPIEELISHLVSSNTIEPLVVYEDRIRQFNPIECKVDVSRDSRRFISDSGGPCYIDGFQVIVELPYSGDPNLWKAKTSKWTSVFPIGQINNTNSDGIGLLTMKFSQPHDSDVKEMKSAFVQNLSLIKDYINWSREEVENYNNSLKRIVTSAIDSRRRRLEKESSITNALGIPLKERKGSPQFEPIKVVKKMVKPLPSPPKSGFKPEPGIADDHYENILKLIRHSGTSFEKTPKTYLIHDEEGLRDIILSHLNALYEGEAKGETFNKSGKTDIIISQGDKSAFIAECKIWCGSKAFLNSIDQLLNYLTWRDCKTALIIFNRKNKDFTSILARIPDIAKSHKFFVHYDNQIDINEWHFTMKAKDDEGLRVRMRVMMFNLYCPN